MSLGWLRGPEDTCSTLYVTLGQSNSSDIWGGCLVSQYTLPFVLAQVATAERSTITGLTRMYSADSGMRLVSGGGCRESSCEVHTMQKNAHHGLGVPYTVASLYKNHLLAILMIQFLAP